MSSLWIYHVNVRADGAMLTVGVCAAGKTDAARLVVERLRSDGYSDVGVDTLGRVAAGSWDPGTVLVYGERAS